MRIRFNTLETKLKVFKIIFIAIRFFLVTLFVLRLKLKIRKPLPSAGCLLSMQMKECYFHGSSEKYSVSGRWTVHVTTHCILFKKKSRRLDWSTLRYYNGGHLLRRGVAATLSYENHFAYEYATRCSLQQTTFSAPKFYIRLVLRSIFSWR